MWLIKLLAVLVAVLLMFGLMSLLDGPKPVEYRPPVQGLIAPEGPQAELSVLTD
jgi:hypothetical protein